MDTSLIPAIFVLTIVNTGAFALYLYLQRVRKRNRDRK